MNNDLANLRGLGNLVHIGGNLAIGIFVSDLDRTRGGNWGLLSLEGLNQLAFIGGTLDIRGNSALLNLSALYRLGFLGGTLDRRRQRPANGCRHRGTHEQIDSRGVFR